MPDNWKRKDQGCFSRLILNEDGTCFFIWNQCDDMYLVTPIYEVVYDKIIIDDVEFNNPHWNEFRSHVLDPAKESDPDGMNIDEGKDITFTIVSEDEIYPDFDIGCVYGYDAYQKGYASFKKE